MQKFRRLPSARLTDVFEIKDKATGQPRSIWMLDRLTHLPKPGDILHLGKENSEILEVSTRNTRNCLTRWPLFGLGQIAVATNSTASSHTDRARKKQMVQWTPKLDAPWHFHETDLPAFEKLNVDWNAHPNAPNPQTIATGKVLAVRFAPNTYQYRHDEDASQITLTFQECSRFRMTPVNDHGWYGGQCRFSGLAPAWGEFYEITGNTRDEMDVTPWTELPGQGHRHFHFYFRDDTLEVKAESWAISPSPA